MTTIVSDGFSMAGDGLRNHNGTITNLNAKKVRRLKDGRLFGTSGDVAFGESVLEWLEKGGERPKLEMDGGFAALLLTTDGQLLLIGEDCKPCPIEAPFAVGSGMDLAIGAMRAGASPQQAVEIAADCDPHTGGKITALFRDGMRAAAA